MHTGGLRREQTTSRRADRQPRGKSGRQEDGSLGKHDTADRKTRWLANKQADRQIDHQPMRQTESHEIEVRQNLLP